jgi:hypothetical protein
MESSPRTYQYRMSWRTIILGGLLFAGVAFGLNAVMANPNASPPFLKWLLSNENIMLIGKMLRNIAAVLVLVSLVQAYNRIFSKPKLILDPDALVLPHGLFLRPKTIPYASIDRVREVINLSQALFIIETKAQKFQIASKMLCDEPTYQEVRNHIRAMIPSAQTGSRSRHLPFPPHRP